jgi:hypothetical protein
VKTSQQAVESGSARWALTQCNYKKKFNFNLVKCKGGPTHLGDACGDTRAPALHLSMPAAVKQVPWDVTAGREI